MPLATWRGRRRLVGAWLRWTRWEFWPPWLFYPPVVLAVTGLLLAAFLVAGCGYLGPHAQRLGIAIVEHDKASLRRRPVPDQLTTDS